MIDVNNIKNCCGCQACVNACPVNAIKMVENHEGFKYPLINKEKCIHCNKCNTVCQIEHENEHAAQGVFYAAINRSSNDLMKSSSGGMFLAIARYIVEKEGYIAGCIFDDSIIAKHVVSNDISIVEKMCGSKYVQSNIGDTYKEIKCLLENGHMVLFTGTPCQVHGLLLFLRKPYCNLITIDLICHGIPSPLLWQRHKDWMEKKKNKKIVFYNFRDKTKSGWSLNYYCRFNDSSTITGISNLDPYYTDFLRGKNYRECCYECKYATPIRCSDITIGDYWGGEQLHENLKTTKGLSLLIVNSEKAKRIIDEIKDSIEVEETNVEYALKTNTQLVKPTIRLPIRDQYYQTVLNDIDRWEKQFRRTREWRTVRIKSMIPARLKGFIKMIIKHK